MNSHWFESMCGHRGHSALAFPFMSLLLPLHSLALLYVGPPPLLNASFLLSLQTAEITGCTKVDEKAWYKYTLSRRESVSTSL